MGERETITLETDTLVYQLYGTGMIEEEYCCNYSLNPEYKHQISRGKLKIAGMNDEHAVRIVELEGHRFFVAMLYLPQMRSTLERPHPVIRRYLLEAKKVSALR